MAVGRITGPLLSKNLLRDGVDLAFETDLLYLDVNNGRIGVKTSKPIYDLDVNGSFRVLGVSKLGNLTITSDTTGTVVNNSSGDLVIQAPAEGKVLINNDTLVKGNIHATGNITANGSVQIGNYTGSDTLSLYADIISDITPQTSNQYNIGAEDKTWANVYAENIIASTIAGFAGQDINIGTPPGQDTNIQAVTNPTINLNGPVRIWGDNPLGTAPIISNTLYVSMDGQDTNDGRAPDASRACRTITGAIRSPFYRPGTSIKVAPGHYLEDNPILMKPHTSIIGSDLRTTMIEPINKTQDLFWVQSGCYLAQMKFLNGQSGLLPGTGYKPGTNRGAYATAFPPNYGQQKIDVYYSPYIQNCTNQSGPWLMDGTMFVPNQTIQIPQAVGTATWTVNTTTLMVQVSEGAIEVGHSINVGPTPQNYVNARTLMLANKEFIKEQVIAYIEQTYPGFEYNRAKCRRDVGILVENISYDMVFGGNQKSVESGVSYWDGVTSVISNEIPQTADAIRYINTLSQAIIANTTATNLLGSFQTYPQVINTALTGGELAGPIISKLVDVIVDITENSPTVAPPVQVGNGPDWGSVSAEVLLHSNRGFIQDEVVDWVNTTFPGFLYREDLCWRDTGLIIDAISQDIILNSNAKSIEAGLSYWQGNKNAIENEVTQTIAALEHAKAVALQVIANTTVTSTAFAYNTSSCYRDTGLIVDGLAQDLLFGGVSQSTYAGVQYWNHGNYVGNIATEINTTTEALMYISTLSQEIIQGITNGVTRYQNTVSQVTSTNLGTIVEADIVKAGFNTVTNILLNGVAGTTDAIIPNSLNPSTTASIVNAYNLLIANEGYLKAEAIAWVEANKVFRYDQVKCARDTGLIVDSIVLDLAFPTQSNSQSTFAGLQYWAQDGFVGDITNEITTTTAAINYISDLAQKIVLNDESGTRYSTGTQITIPGAAATPSEQAKIDDEFTIITDILANGVLGITDDIITPASITSSTNISIKNACALLQANKEYIKEEAVAFVEATKTLDFEYSQTKCARDVGFMVDSVSFDLLYGGNRQAIQSGVYYYKYINGDSTIPGEINQTLAAYQFLKALTMKIAANTPVTPLQTSVARVFGVTPATPYVTNTIDEQISKITQIIEFGPDMVAVKEPISVIKNTDANYITASENLLANREFIKAEVIAYINEYLTFKYDPELCARDVGYIVRSIAFDLLYGGNRQAIQSGVYYWGYSDDHTSLPNERSATTQAYEYLKTLVQNVVSATPMIVKYQSVVPQVTNLPAGTNVEIEAINSNIDLIVDIINAGPEVAPPKTPIGLVKSNNAFVNNAANLLHANREFIQAEIIAFVDSVFVSNTQLIIPFYDKGANATLDVIRNFDIIIDIIEKGPGAAPVVSQGNGIFVKTGLSMDDIKTAPVVTNVTSMGGNLYKIDISQSTIGYGDDHVLYFGDTAVFPKLDDDVPDRWQQRRINPIGSMGGSLVDGGVVSARSPIQSFVYDAYTQVNQGGRGIHVINNGYAQLVSVFTIFCSQAVTVENGGICSITNSNSNFGDICLTAKGYGRREFTGYVKNPPFPTDVPNGEFFPAGYWPQAGQVEVYVADPDLRPHIALVMEVEPPESYVNVQGLPGFLSGSTNINVLTTGTIEISGIDNTGMVVGQKFHVRDQFGRTHDENGVPYVVTGTVISDVGYQSVTLNYPLASGGGEINNTNYFTLYSCGNAYYTVLSSTTKPLSTASGTLLLPNNQNIAESSSTVFINNIAQQIITNSTVTALQNVVPQVFDPTIQGGGSAGAFIENEFDIISSILVNGPTSAPEITRSGPIPSGAASAASLLTKNRAFIQAETIEYVNSIYTQSYNTATCKRDVGFLVDAIVNDLATGGNYNAVIAGKSYYATSGTNHIVQLEDNVTDPALFPDGAIVNFYQRSYMSASGYLFEYVGAGTNYGALPQRGVADPVQSKEVVQLNNGKVFFTSTDQNGDFRIGPGLVISQATGVLSGRTFTKSLFANLTPFILAIEG